MKDNYKVPVCSVDEVHCDVVKRKVIPPPEEIYDLADLFKILGDSTRLSIILAVDGEPMCVCDIAELLSMTKSAVSHQLKILRQCRLVGYRRSGKNVFYFLSDGNVRDILKLSLKFEKENRGETI